MSDEIGIRFSVLHSVSGCYAEVHISWENVNYHVIGHVIGGNYFSALTINGELMVKLYDNYMFTCSSTLIAM